MTNTSLTDERAMTAYREVCEALGAVPRPVFDIETPTGEGPTLVRNWEATRFDPGRRPTTWTVVWATAYPWALDHYDLGPAVVAEQETPWALGLYPMDPIDGGASAALDKLALVLNERAADRITELQGLFIDLDTDAYRVALTAGEGQATPSSIAIIEAAIKAVRAVIQLVDNDLAPASEM